ncbi:hypothetical protein [Enteractinococcus coprophilus]|uniref:N-acetylglucosamine-6-phosphate deacetylase n=1 Tax=Enteractinococcus coprophilus TaxID=1027633 RepID=A0A543AIE0_9MICC|nr:hypothetical protein [Enteractinococcus coprophilus]TQL65833.1 N-acetylglucosamine-6-phosphate deacetylase [Enteractinococcus coprophilus]TQL72343.1 N-acetylglucosamine-6-phosphate deacetylase [Enteractinococcus coprophilus]
MLTPAFSKCTNTFADRHIHGVAGVDFATSDVQSIQAALRLLASRRTTGVTASIPTIGLAALPDTLNRLRAAHVDGLVDGVHLEGPFLAPEFAGAHPRSALLAPNEDPGKRFLETVFNYQDPSRLITMMTLAPELPGFEATVEQLVEAGIAPALGHTGATYLQMRHGIAFVYALTGEPVTITHLYNAMRGFHHRDPGPILAVMEAAARGEVVVELIADGFHVDLEVVRWWFDLWPATIRLVSDASAATLPTGVQPLTAQPPRLGHVELHYPTAASPQLAGRATLASGGKDLLAIHDDLVAAGLNHDQVCAAMQR